MDSVLQWWIGGLIISNIAAWRLSWSLWCVNCDLRETIDEATDLANDHMRQIENLFVQNKQQQMQQQTQQTQQQQAAAGHSSPLPTAPISTQSAIKQGYLKLYSPHNN